MTLDGKNFLITQVYAAAETEEDLVYTVPAGLILFIKEILILGEGAAFALYTGKGTAAPMAEVAANTGLLARLVAVNNAAYQPLSIVDIPAAETQVIARNTVLEAGDSIFLHGNEAGATTRLTFIYISGDESAV